MLVATGIDQPHPTLSAGDAGPEVLAARFSHGEWFQVIAFAAERLIDTVSHEGSTLEVDRAAAVIRLHNGDPVNCAALAAEMVRFNGRILAAGAEGLQAILRS